MPFLINHLCSYKFTKTNICSQFFITQMYYAENNINKKRAFTPFFIICFFQQPALDSRFPSRRLSGRFRFSA